MEQHSTAVERRRRAVLVGLMLVTVTLWMVYSALPHADSNTAPSANAQHNDSVARNARGTDNRQQGRQHRYGASSRPASADVTVKPSALPQQVTVLPADSDRVGTIEGNVVSSFDHTPIGGAEITFTRHGIAYSTFTSANGRFRFQSREAGTYGLALVVADAYEPFSPAFENSPVQLSLQLGKRLVGVAFELDPTCTRRGLVVDAQEQPVDGALVRPLSMRRSAGLTTDASSAHAPAYTDAAGHFTIQGAGRLTLVASHPEHGKAMRVVRLTPGERTEIRLRLVPPRQPKSEERKRDHNARHIISGRVLGPDSAPLVGAQVAAMAASPHSNTQALATSDEDGRFELQGLAPGRYVVTAIYPHVGRQSLFDVRAGTSDLVLRLAAGGRVYGLVLDEDTRAPVPHFAVQVSTTDGKRRGSTAASNTVYSPDGSYSIGGLASGKYTVSASAPGFMPTTPMPFRIDLEGTGLGRKELYTDFLLKRGGALKGRVIDIETEAPVRFARLFISGWTPSAELVPSEDARTDETGHFALQGLPPGRCSITVSAEGYHDRIVSGIDVSVDAGASPLVVTLTPVPPDKTKKVEYVGIGATIKKVSAGGYIVSVVPDGGAFLAGIGPGDIIVTIEGNPASRMDITTLTNALRGAVDTYVSVGVRHQGETGALDAIDIRRRRLQFTDHAIDD